MEKCLKVRGSQYREFNDYLYWIYQHGGPDNLALWCINKLQNNGISIQYVKENRMKIFLKYYSYWLRAEREVQAEEIRSSDRVFAKKRADNMVALRKRAIAESEQREHPHAAIKRRLEQSLKLNIPQQVVSTKGHSTKRIGECGQRIGEKIDSILWMITHHEDEAYWPDDEPLELDDLLNEIRTQPEPSCESACCVPPVLITASAAPPSPLGAGEQSADATTVAAGGCSGFTNDLSTVWDAFSGMEDCANDISDFLIEIDENPRLRSSANLRTLGRVRDELEKIPENASLRDPVVIQLQDVLILMSQITSRLR